jgi:hypothetical protein
MLYIDNQRGFHYIPFSQLGRETVMTNTVKITALSNHKPGILNNYIRIKLSYPEGQIIPVPLLVAHDMLLLFLITNQHLML